jgi:hypothetical protein
VCGKIRATENFSTALITPTSLYYTLNLNGAAAEVAKFISIGRSVIQTRQISLNKTPMIAFSLSKVVRYSLYFMSLKSELQIKNDTLVGR